MGQKLIWRLKVNYHFQTIQQIIKAIDANKSIPKVNILDATKMRTLCWEDVTEETIKKRFAKSRISPKDQANTQNDLQSWK